MKEIQQQHQQQHQLDVVIKCKELIKIVYKIIKTIPEERYCANPQILRSALSIPSNIVEGQQRTDKEFIRFLRIAKGSLEELKIQVEIMYEIYGNKSRDYYSDKTDNNFISLSNEIGAMIYGLSRKIKADAVAGAGAEN